MKISEKKIVLSLFVGGAVFLIMGILLLAVAVPTAASAFYTVMLSLLGVFVLLLGAVTLWLAYLFRDTDAHFFRYDPSTGRNIALSDVDFDRVNNRMSAYVNRISGSQEELWQGNIFAECDPERFGPNGVYSPLLAYKMLYDLAEIDKDDTWMYFTSASPELIDALSEALRQAGESAMSDTLLRAYNEVSDVSDIEWIRDFIKGNRRYIQRRTLQYVHINDEMFY